MKGDSRVEASRDSLEFFQRRVALFALIVGGLGAVFLAFRIVVTLVTGRPDYLLQPEFFAHVLAVGFLAGVWWTCRSKPRSQRFVVWAESLGFVGSCLSYELLGAFLPPVARPDLIVLLALTLGLLGRAVFVPGTAARAAFFGLVLGPPLVALTWWSYSRSGPELVGVWGELFDGISIEGLTLLSCLNVAVWWTVSTALAAAVAHVIHGLRLQARQAARLGQYALEEPIGAGGMGIVYKASHVMLRRPTAVKLLSTSNSDQEAVRRFEREVQITASLTHPNTVTIFDYGRTPDGIFYYAMELIDGMNLREVVELSGPQPAARVIHILQQVAGALAEAHATGLIHRDIKPGNILLCRQGGIEDVAKVVDFGLVRDLGSGEVPSEAAASRVMGTPAFMPPEAISAPLSVDGRSDLYALAATGYFLLVGEPIFAGASPMEACAHHLHTRPRPPGERVPGGLAQDFERLLMSCLEKDPARRPQSASLLAEALRECEDFRGWSAVEAHGWWSRHAGEVAELRARAVPSPDQTTLDGPRQAGHLSVDVGLGTGEERAEGPVGERARRA